MKSCVNGGLRGKKIMRIMSASLAKIINDFDRNSSRNPARQAIVETNLSQALDTLSKRQEMFLAPENQGPNRMVPAIYVGTSLVK